MLRISGYPSCLWDISLFEHGSELLTSGPRCISRDLCKHDDVIDGVSPAALESTSHSDSMGDYRVGSRSTSVGLYSVSQHDVGMIANDLSMYMHMSRTQPCEHA